MTTSPSGGRRRTPCSTGSRPSPGRSRRADVPRSSSCSPRASAPSTTSPARSTSRWPTPPTTCARSPVPGSSPPGGPAPTSTTGSPPRPSSTRGWRSAISPPSGSTSSTRSPRLPRRPRRARDHHPRRARVARLERGELVLIDVRPEAEYAAGTSPGRSRPHPTSSTGPRRPPRRGRRRRLLPRPLLRLRRRRRPRPAGPRPPGAAARGGPPGVAPQRRHHRDVMGCRRPAGCGRWRTRRSGPQEREDGEHPPVEAGPAAVGPRSEAVFSLYQRRYSHEPNDVASAAAGPIALHEPS
jgi:hypothetical protein